MQRFYVKRVQYPNPPYGVNYMVVDRSCNPQGVIHSSFKRASARGAAVYLNGSSVPPFGKIPGKLAKHLWKNYP